LAHYIEELKQTQGQILSPVSILLLQPDDAIDWEIPSEESVHSTVPSLYQPGKWILFLGDTDKV